MTTPEPHCPGEPNISPWRESSHGTVFAVSVCACGAQMNYVELEIAEGHLEAENAPSVNLGPPRGTIAAEEDHQ